jgi:outer membrane protein
MNKFKLVLLAAFIAISSAALAQKTGYISVDQMISIMPEVAKIDSQLQKFQMDSIASEYEIIVKDYKYRDSLLNGPDTLKMPKSVRTQHEQALQQDAYQLQNWNQISQNVIQSKQNQLLAPVYRKVMGAIQAVAKEKGYTHVYDKSVFVIAPTGDDLLPAVAARLKVTVPKELQIGLQ